MIDDDHIRIQIWNMDSSFFLRIEWLWYPCTTAVNCRPAARQNHLTHFIRTFEAPVSVAAWETNNPTPTMPPAMKCSYCSTSNRQRTTDRTLPRPDVYLQRRIGIRTPLSLLEQVLDNVTRDYESLLEVNAVYQSWSFPEH